MKLDKRNIILIGIILGVGLISWQFTIKNTISYKNQIEGLQLQQLQLKQQEFERLAKKNRMLQKAIEEQNISQSSIREVLFKEANSNKTVQILHYNDDVVHQSENFNTRFYQIELKGDYKELINLTDNLLNKSSGSHIISYSFLHQKRNYKSNDYLLLHLTLRGYE